MKLKGILGAGTRRGRTSGPGARPAAMAEDERRIAALSMEEARDAATLRLVEDSNFECIPTGESEPLPEGLAPGLTALFRRYRSISCLGVSRLSLDDWQECPQRPGQYIVGWDAEEPIVVARGAEQLTVDDGSAPSETYPSVYHWLLSLGAGSPGLRWSGLP